MENVVGERARVTAGLSEDDRLLIRGFLSGDPHAVEIIDGWVEVVLRTGFRALQGEWDDLRQEVRFRVLANLRKGRFHGESELRTYVHRIAKNTAIDQLRVAARRRDSRNPTSPGEDDDRGAADSQTSLLSRDLLGKLLASLSREERDLLTMVHARHLSYSEIARALGVAEGTIKARVFRCRERMHTMRKRLLRPGPS